MAAATAWYREGTVSVTSGSKAIVGSGTSWLSQVLPGDLFYLADANGNLTSVPAEVDTVSSDTAIALKAIWPGSTVSGVKYGIVRHFNNTLPADLSARLSKLIAGYQITVDQLITLMTSSGQVTITGLDGNNYTVLGLLGYANQVPDHNANDSAHGMTAPGRTLLRAASYADQRAAIGALAAASPASSGAWVHDGTAEIKGAAALHGNTALVASARLNIGDGALWKPGVQIGTSPYSGLYGPALTYLAAVASGGWVSTGGGTASALTVDEGYLSFATSGGVPSSGTALSWTTRLRIDPNGRTQINGSFYLRDELRPVVDNNHSIGEATLRFATGYFATNPIIGSDSRLKTDIEEIPGAIAADIMQSLRPVTFRYRVGGQEAYEEDEPFEEQVQVTEPVEVPKITIQIVDGKAVQVTTAETVQQPVYDEFPLVDGDGSPVMQLVTPAVLDNKTGEEITPAVYVQAIHREPRLTTVTKARKVTKYREVEGKRYHAGYIAQEVKAALDAVADRWPPAADLAVWLLSDTDDADSTQMVRMEQMTPILHAAMRHLHA